MLGTLSIAGPEIIDRNGGYLHPELQPPAKLTAALSRTARAQRHGTARRSAASPNCGTGSPPPSAAASAITTFSSAVQAKAPWRPRCVPCVRPAPLSSSNHRPIPEPSRRSAPPDCDRSPFPSITKDFGPTTPTRLGPGATQEHRYRRRDGGVWPPRPGRPAARRLPPVGLPAGPARLPATRLLRNGTRRRHHPGENYYPTDNSARTFASATSQRPPPRILTPASDACSHSSRTADPQPGPAA